MLVLFLVSFNLLLGMIIMIGPRDSFFKGQQQPDWGQGTCQAGTRLRRWMLLLCLGRVERKEMQT